MKRRTVLTPDDWAEAALFAAGESGLGGVTIDALARRLKVSKGSFYWHFEGLDALREAACARWEHLATEAPIESLEAIGDPRLRLEALLEFTLDRLEHLKIEVAIAAAAGRGDRHARPVYERVTRRRLDYVERLYAALGHPPAQARAWARLAFGAYLGTLQLAVIGVSSFGSDQEMLAHTHFLKATLVPPAPVSPPAGPRARRSR